MRQFFAIISFFLIISCSSTPKFSNDQLSKEVTVTQIKGGYSIVPNCYNMEKGFIFYPGGLVNPESYIPLMTDIAKNANIAIFIKKMPFDLAVLNPNGAKNILEDYNYIKTWYIGGHSLGGVMAASYVYENQGTFKGLILFASYPVEKKSLKDTNLKVLSILGSNDGLVDINDFNNSKNNLPKGSIFKIIPGGNHAQFGSYGKQKGDLDATISEKEQHNIVTSYFSSFINN